MKTINTAEITITGSEIVRDYVCQALNKTVSEYNDIKENITVFLDITQNGSVDTGDYKEILDSIKIEVKL